jgi:hypothetical protein
LSAESQEGSVAEAENILRLFATAEDATLERKELTDRLVGFKLLPSAERAAPISVFVSRSETIVEAGRGTRFELDGLPASADELKEILDAIARGRLYERRGFLALRFKLEVRPGRTLSGRVFGRGGQRGAIQYAAYRLRDPKTPGYPES